MIVYMKNPELTPAAVGNLENPIKMIIENESNIMSAQNGICKQLFNIEKSNHYGETIVAYDELGVFEYVESGSSGTYSRNMRESYYKFIEHVQFMKEFVISAQMIEDSNFGISADVKRRAESFIRSYYKTINKLCEAILVGAIDTSVDFGDATIDTSAPDGKALFASDHAFGPSGRQSNYYAGDIVCTGSGSDRKYSTEVFEESLSRLNIIFRNMKDESGDSLGYNLDTIILPANRPELESIVKKTCGSYGALGTSNNDINLHYGNYNIIVLPGWTLNYDSMMLMSSEANKNLNGNMFFNRIPLTISNWVDNHSGNYIWNGRCRFGLGFGSYKHIMRVDDSETGGNELSTTF